MPLHRSGISAVIRGILHSNPYQSMSAVSQQPVNLYFGSGQTVSQQSPQRCERHVLITLMGELVSNVAHPGPRATALATDQAPGEQSAQWLSQPGPGERDRVAKRRVVVVTPAIPDEATSRRASAADTASTSNSWRDNSRPMTALPTAASRPRGPG